MGMLCCFNILIRLEIVLICLWGEWLCLSGEIFYLVGEFLCSFYDSIVNNNFFISNFYSG